MLRYNKAVFLDLNGTLVLPLKQESLSEMKLVSDADLAVAKLIEEKFVCPVITIQSGIAKGRFTEYEFRIWFSNFFSELRLDVKGPYICPHRFAEPCLCKKPGLLLYKQAAKDYSIDLSRSYVIGDTASDVMAGKKMGGTGCLVKTGWKENESEYENAKHKASYIGYTIGEVVDWILTNERNNME